MIFLIQLLLLFTSVGSCIAESKNCPQYFESSHNSMILKEGGFPRSRCFMALKGKFDSVHKILRYCETHVVDGDGKLHHGHVFEPRNKREIITVREWLSDKLDNFCPKSSALWLGFEKPRNCDGTGRTNKYVGHSTELCKVGVEMNMDIFAAGEPNYLDQEFCTLNRREDVVWNFKCAQMNYMGLTYNDYLEAHAVCEIDLA
ncbi:uncharacterized protein LOC142350887 isoform X2 [Convolutriloba macropyga]|uniref:uncharacterized protein LOC142350887 isoform X2 n=1 Tax=Convolutriloba macropyga TaxID=536237 RepID=UPI003F526AB2